MRCMHCSGEIKPEWVHAIQSNLCPGCGKEIMNDATQSLLKELSDAIEKMPNDPQGVAGWLLSNYRFQKVGSGELVEKFNRPGGAGPSHGDMKVDPTYNQFIKNSDAGKLVSKGQELAQKFGKATQGNSQFADMASAIAAAGDPYGEDGVSSDLDDGNEEVPDADQHRAYAQMKAEGYDPFAGNSIGGVTSGKMADMIEMSGADPNVIRSLANIMGSSSKQIDDEVALSQTEAGRNYLKRDRFKKLKAQDAVDGGGGGVFRR